MNTTRRTRPLRFAGLLTGLALTAASLSFSSGPATAGGPKPVKPTIVLVHGAWADASGWNGVIERLQKDGYTAVAVANPLRGLAADSTYLDTVIASIEGPIVLVGHSYGGEVIGQTTPDPDVKSLVYVSAFIPDTGEDAFSISARFPGSKIGPDTIRTVPLPSGDADIYLRTETFAEVFAGGLSAKTARLLGATQRPITYGALSEPAQGTPAWKRLPSWAVISKTDQAIPVAAQRFMTARAGSHTLELNASHVALITKAGAVADVIEKAAR
ncbi:pimeloyl-ACP methyl ester carboxylesterase [Actinocorallia herbida]|uniref:Pimeloyl-ACP methyl ester carboxylesterase n=1 Tax=Actinocorallia herbida TaxID=58109 RepID=A0A3N1CXB7_9ACTN|nr:alpha/beta hydrolase [Actinocorallia herbida]ROO85368.1 pimeloyl-ACP methyl ester carboxylesterase [Actinocorallia herbida]